MTGLPQIVLLLWVPVGLVLYWRLPVRKAVFANLILGWLLLPVASWPLPGFPDWNKANAIAIVALLGAVLKDRSRFIAFRPHWMDLPWAGFCLSTLLTSLWAGLGWHDGVSAAFSECMVWGVPYFLGRVYITTPEQGMEFLRSVAWGGLLYLPFCLWEILFGPHLNELLYGFYANDFMQAWHMGGWRPVVFLHNGLMLAFWMAAASLAALGVWRSRGQIGAGFVFAALLLVTIATRSVNAWTVVAAGMILLGAVPLRRQVLVGILLVIPLFVLVRATGAWQGSEIVALLQPWNPARAQSMEYRLENEDAIAFNVRSSPLFGLGRTRAAFFDHRLSQMAVPDSLWIIVLGEYGMIGLSLMIGMLLLPAAYFLYRHPAAFSLADAGSPMLALVVIVVLQAVDHMVNASLNPVMIAASGAVASFGVSAGNRGEDAR